MFTPFCSVFKQYATFLLSLPKRFLLYTTVSSRVVNVSKGNCYPGTVTLHSTTLVSLMKLVGLFNPAFDLNEIFH